MALTKVTGHVVKPDTNIQFHNTKSTGIVTFTHTSNATSSTTGALQITGGVGIVKDLFVGGNITVGGTITYDDVTNIDSLGIITARTDIHLGQSLAHLGDTDTKITFDTDEIKFDTANEQRLCIRPNGKIGIGTTNPSGTLTIHGGAGNPGLALKRNTGGGDVASISWASDSANYAMINYRDAAPHGLQFYSGGTASSNLSMIIRLNGNVGIASEIPTQKLDVNGTSQFQDDVILTNSNHVTQILKAGGATSDLHIDFKDSSNNLEARIFCASDQGDLRFYTGGANERIRIKSSGHFGINEDNPIHQLSIGINTSTAFAANKNVSNTTNNDFIGLNLTNKNTGSNPEIGIMFQAGTSGAGQYTLNCLRTASGTADLIFRTRSGGGSSSAEVLRFTSGGSVGINETEPSEKLQIDGDILLGGQANPSESNYAVKFEYNNHQFAKIVGDGRDQSGYGDIDFYTSTGSGVTNLTQRMTIRADGKVGIGTELPDTLFEIYNSSTAGNTSLKIHNDKTGDAAQLRLEGGRTSTNDCGQLIFANRGNVVSGIIADSAADDGNLTFRTSATGSGNSLSTYLQIAANGNIKLGKNSQNAPGARLHLEDSNGTAYNANATTSAASVYLVNTASNGPMGMIFQNTSTNGTNTCQATISSVAEGTNKDTALTFGTRQDSDATIRERLRIHSTGLVEANTRYSATYSTTTSISPHLRARNQNGTDNIYGGIQLRADRGTGAAAIFNIACLNTSTNFESVLIFQSRNSDGNFSEKMRIDKIGRVMIGTTTEGGATGDEFTVSTSGHTGMTIRSGSSHEGNIFFADTDGDNQGIIRYEHDNDAMVFKTNATGQERLRIASNGDVKVVARGSDTSGAPFYVGVTAKSSITYAGGNADTACLRVVDNGSTNGYYHGIELRSRQGADVRLYCQDQGNDLSHFVIATDNSALLERARFTQHGLQLQPYTTDSANSGYPISTFTDGGTRFATHLATMSGYSGNGEIIVITNFGDHQSGSEMFSVRITGYWYSNSTGGAIDCVVGAYAGEGSYHNASVTGTYPVNWRDKIKFASITSGNNQGKMCIRLGEVGSANDCEIAFTDCTHGFYGVNQSKTSGWRVIKVNDATTISNTYNGTVRTAVHRSNSFHNDEFTVYGSGTGELLTNRPGQGGTIMGMYQYTQYNQGQNYEHLIRSPHGHTDITDSYADSNWMALISASVDGTSTVDTGTTYFCQDNSDDNNSLSITNKFGYSGNSGSSNRIYMVVNNGRVAWKMDHPGSYRISVTVQFLAGGKKNGTYNTVDTAYQSN